ncbi:MAG: WbqC family protein [Bacteroidales bacterium]|nr:WbqC family protein [Bacteroidales bacterium]
MLLTTAYFPPISWFAAVASEFTLSPDRVNPSMLVLEACENYQKQSYRNRCRIYSAGGVEDLNVPVVHEGGTFKLPITSIKVDYSVPWVQKTERAICAAYDSSPYFEYYKDDLFAILDSHPETLWELNLRLIRFFLAKTGIAAQISMTESFSLEHEGTDRRWTIHPKKENTVLSELQLEKPYFQVFARKYGFKPDLSIMDLLFNEGPDSIVYLKKF